MKHTASFMLWAVLMLLLPFQFVQTADIPTELQKKLQSLPGISDVKPIESDAYPEKYVLFID